MRTACAARAAARGGYFCRSLLFVRIFRSLSRCILFFAAAMMFPCSHVFSRAADCLRQLSESRLVFSFFRERKRTKKIFRGGVPPPRKLPLPRLGRATSRHRSTDASARHLKCGVRYSLQCSAQIMPEPSGGADSFPQRTRAWGQRKLFAQRRGGLAYGEIIPQPFFEIALESG